MFKSFRLFHGWFWRWIRAIIFFRLPNTLRRLKEYFKGKKLYIWNYFFFKDTAFFRVLIQMFIFGKKYLVLNETSFGCNKTAESGFHRQSLLKKPRMSNKYTAQILAVSRQFLTHWHIFGILPFSINHRDFNHSTNNAKWHEMICWGCMIYLDSLKGTDYRLMMKTNNKKLLEIEWKMENSRLNV